MERTTSPQDPPVILELNNQLFREVGAIPETITRISERPQHNDYYFDDSNLQNTSYPYSVSEDYLQYQLWDTLQAFASSMTSALATEAVLKGAGVGDQSASALAASLTWLAKDGLGMLGRIAFGFFKGR
ncbi:hypothetical protein Y032_0674g1416 [Ancylostoma ceylanicum]|uniref:Protein root UVB sensitive/RUS domain-containing protein n=1 Tax=Ancylostoma ceylanicum TaxID=53326 RepID=A0A016WH56_9BILA|nr:hypothetical protein Y032_0674g1416 [Ancylostoma ceylanicum]